MYDSCQENWRYLTLGIKCIILNEKEGNMKKLLISIMIAALVLMTGCITTKGPYYAPQVSRIYDDEGHLVGKIHHHKYESRVYDDEGRFMYKIR